MGNMLRRLFACSGCLDGEESMLYTEHTLEEGCAPGPSSKAALALVLARICAEDPSDRYPDLVSLGSDNSFGSVGSSFGLLWQTQPPPPPALSAYSFAAAISSPLRCVGSVSPDVYDNTPPIDPLKPASRVYSTDSAGSRLGSAKAKSALGGAASVSSVSSHSHNLSQDKDQCSTTVGYVSSGSGSSSSSSGGSSSSSTSSSSHSRSSSSSSSIWSHGSVGTGSDGGSSVFVSNLALSALTPHSFDVSPLSECTAIEGMSRGREEEEVGGEDSSSTRLDDEQPQQQPPPIAPPVAPRTLQEKLAGEGRSDCSNRDERGHWVHSSSTRSSSGSDSLGYPRRRRENTRRGSSE